MRGHAARRFKRGFQHVPDLGGDIGVAVVAHRHVVHVPQGGAGHAEHLIDGAARKAGHMFEARAQAFLGHGGHQLAVPQHAGRRIRVKRV